MYSLNAPVPAPIEDLHEDTADVLDRFEVVRTDLQFVIKRFGDLSLNELQQVQHTLQRRLQGWTAMSASVRSFGVFVDPAGGPAPVLYLAIDSPGVESLHRDLVAEFGAVSDAIEGDAYVPHITVARGGDRTDIAAVTGQTFDPIRWDIDELYLWDDTYGQPVERYQLSRPMG